MIGSYTGNIAERSKAPVLKIGVQIAPWVQIPLFPLFFRLLFDSINRLSVVVQILIFKMFLIFNFLKDLTLDNFFLVNFYISYQNFCLFFQLLDVLPEVLLLFFILYSLVSLFNDKKHGGVQYYRWFFYLICILILILLVPHNTSNETTIIFGFALINC